MAITRKMLKAMGIEEEKIEQIIEAHTETVEGLKEKAEENAEAVKNLAKVQKELDDAKKDIEAMKKDSFKVKYDAIKEEFEEYKNGIEKKETRNQFRFKALLSSAAEFKSKLTEAVNAKGWKLVYAEEKKPNLEEIFLKLTANTQEIEHAQ